MDQLSEASREALSIFEKNNVPLLPMSAITEEGVMEVKQQVFLRKIIYFILNSLIIIVSFLFIRLVILFWLIVLKIKSKLRKLIQF